MRDALTELYIHIIWATWDRQPLLTPDHQKRIYSCIQKECSALKVELLSIGGTADHIHLLVRIPAAVSIALLVKQIKGVSSHLVNHEMNGNGTFRWQGSYAAFTVSKRNLDSVRKYIEGQIGHHADRTDEIHIE